MPSIRNFVSHVSEPTLLQRFLNSYSISFAADFLSGPAKSVADAVEQELDNLPPGKRTQLTHQIETVERMSTEAGQTAIESVTLDDETAGLPSNQARALWLLMQDEHRFRRASDIVYTDAHRYSRQWNSFNGPVNATPDLNPESMEAFKEALRQAFDTPNIHIDVYERTRPEFLEAAIGETADSGKINLMQFTIYSEGRPNAENTFVEGALTTQIRRPVVEAAVTYEPAKGIIECVASQRESRDAVVKAFGVSVLGCSPDFEPCRARNYDLTVLQERIEFETDPADRIEKVSVSLLRLLPMESASARITVEKLAGDKDIWTVVDERLGEGNLKTDYRIQQARIQISYRTGKSDRIRTLPLTITHPHRSNIKEQSEIERVIASKYLPRWGLVVSA